MNEIRNRWTGEVTHPGKTLADILDAHNKWLWGRDGGARANLTGADLTGAVLTRADLTGADLTGADLTRADLTGADLTRADLTRAVLTRADLTGAVLTDAVLTIHAPKIVNIHQRVYAAASADGALDMTNWHSCETTHCRAGWVCTLAGEAGAVLESCLGTGLAAALIYLASDPTIGPLPDFFASDSEALADMKRLADEEAKRNPVTAE